MMEDATVSHRSRLWLYGYCLVLAIFLLVPVFIIVPMSFSPGEFLEFPPRSLSLRWYESFFASAEWMDSAMLSLKVAVLTMLIATPLGVAASYGLHQSTNPFAGFIRSVLIVPLVIPVIIIAIGVFYLYARIGLINTIAGLVLAHTVLALPFVLIITSAGLQQFDMNQERVAMSLGATRLGAFFSVTAPQIKASLTSAAFFAFITSFDEVVIALFISRGASSTLTRKMFTSLRDQVSPTIAAISTMLILLTVVLAALTLWISSRHRATT
ncbi:ABC transporter permease [Aestuariivirga sp.]|uniref:ABC transporter permease n=1 Tax=Aestuariivirga sp. TaxID=2650926 RepID=UPI003BAA8F17